MKKRSFSYKENTLYIEYSLNSIGEKIEARIVPEDVLLKGSKKIHERVCFTINSDKKRSFYPKNRGPLPKAQVFQETDEDPNVFLPKKRVNAA